MECRHATWGAPASLLLQQCGLPMILCYPFLNFSLPPISYLMKIPLTRKSKRLSPFLNIWPDINLMRESSSRLRVEIPIRIGDLSLRLV